MAAAVTKIKEHFRPSGNDSDDPKTTIHNLPLEEQRTTDDDLNKPTAESDAGGAAKIQAAQAIWGRTGKYFLYFG